MKQPSTLGRAFELIKYNHVDGYVYVVQMSSSASFSVMTVAYAREHGIFCEDDGNVPEDYVAITKATVASVYYAVCNSSIGILGETAANMAALKEKINADITETAKALELMIPIHS